MKRDLIVIIGNLHVGGTERHLVNVLPKLVDAGWTVRVIVMRLGDKGVLAPVLEHAGVKVLPVLIDRHYKLLNKFPNGVKRLVRIIWCVAKLCSILKKEKSVVLHFFLPESYILGMISAILVGSTGPKIMSRRSLNNYQKRRPMVGWFERKLHAKTQMITGNSQAVMRQLIEEGIPQDRLRLIYNGFNDDGFSSPNAREKMRLNLKIPQHALVMIIVANLIPYKGHHDLLTALGNIKENLPSDWYLLCVGRDDGIGESLKISAAKFQISEHILWLGSRENIQDLLAVSDIGLLCSHEEGFSNAILEGMAVGLPMVVTDVGGNKEAVIHEETGYVVESKKPEALGQAILELANYPNLAKQFGLAGQKRVKEHFSLEVCVNEYVKLYEDCLAKDSELSGNSEKSKSFICAD